MKEQLEQIVLQMYGSGLPFSEAVRDFQRAFLAVVLREANANQVKAATRLGIHRNTLRRQIRELEVDVKALRVSRRPPWSQQVVVERKFVGTVRKGTGVLS